MDSRNRVINGDHEFSAAPNLFNYRKGETEEQMNNALFEGALSYASSNKTSRTTQIESLCDLSEAENSQKLQEAKSKVIIVKPPNFAQKKQEIKRQKLEVVKPRQNHQWKTNLTTPKIKNSKELEKEKLDKAPNFKARPLNKKILESKGELGLFCNKKQQVTIPQEFNFSINERIPPRRTANGAELLDKIALCLKSHNKKLIPRITIQRPFHLHTEERGKRKKVNLWSK
ncbi:hypothetical protein L2E82_42442 [Cichorium intybus]|uniref:Uncharacterized protein n=1 Tax=Cichorium intybus TaxID=13427 RepID=A0ACB8ZLL4_CICIN|nr:hypothetical protein L2E82_42442 [Cichorium intybus]